MLKLALRPQKLEVKQLLASFILLAFAVLLISSCGDTCADKRFFVWAPDGKHAIFKNDDVIRIMDGKGKLSEFKLKAGIAAWCPDSENFVAVCEEKVESWEQFRAFFDEKTQNQITEGGKFFSLISKKYKNTLLQKLDKDDLSEEDQARVEAIEKNSGFQSVLAYLYFNDKQALRELWSKKKKDKQADDEEFIEMFMPSATTIRLYNITESSVVEKSLLYKETASIDSIAVSPNNRAIAFVESEKYRGENEKKLEGNVLKVIPLSKKKKPIIVAKNVKNAVDWNKQNNFVVFFRKNNSLSELCWADVIGKNGKLIPAPKVEDIVDLVYPDAYLKCTDNGAIFFKTTERTYPHASKQETDNSESLYLIEPLKYQSVVKITSCTSDYTDISPDGKRVSNLWCDGTVSIFELQTADKKDIQEKKIEKKIYESVCIRPTFRSNSEICYSAPLEKPKGDRVAKVVMKDLKTGKVKTLSKKWTDEVSTFLLKPKEEDEEKKSDDKDTKETKEGSK